MDALTILVICIFLFFLFLGLRNDKNKLRSTTAVPQQKAVAINQGFKRKGRILNTSEMAFYYELVKQLPNGYTICPCVRLIDFIDPLGRSREFYNRRNKIMAKHVDFLVIDNYFRPVVAFEVNGTSHQRSDRIARDKEVSEIFRDAGIPLVWVNVGMNFSHTIEKYFNQKIV